MDSSVVDLLSLNSNVRNASSFEIQTFKNKLTDNLFKTIFTGYLQSINNKFKNEKHAEIIKLASDHWSTVNPIQNEVSIFNTLHDMLVAEIISYLNQKERATLSTVNFLFCKASSQSIAKHTIKLNKKFIKYELCKRPQDFKYNNVGTIIFTDDINSIYHNIPQKLHTNVQNNLNKLMQNPIRSYQGCSITNCNIICFNLPLVYHASIEFRNNITNFPDKRIVAHARSINCQTTWDTSRVGYGVDYVGYSFLWGPGSNFNFSNLTHLTLCKSYGFVLSDSSKWYHPIYWLWNIPQLESCELGMTLPISTVFETNCDATLPLRKKKRSNKLKELKLHVTIKDVALLDGRKRDIMDNLKLSSDYEIYIEHVLELYPNLNLFKCNMMPFNYGYKQHLDILEVEPLCFKHDSFKGLQQIDISILTLGDAANLLSVLKYQKQLTAVKINIFLPRVDCSILDEYDTISLEEDLDNFRYVIMEFVKNKCESLISFIVSFDKITAAINTDIDAYWKFYTDCLEDMLNMHEKEKKIYNGYFQVGLPQSEDVIQYKHAKHLDSEPRIEFLNKIYSWNKQNIQHSLNITQLLTRIQTSMETYNDINKNKKTLIMELPGLQLYREHKNFLAFWFLELVSKKYTKFIMH